MNNSYCHFGAPHLGRGVCIVELAVPAVTAPISAVIIVVVRVVVVVVVVVIFVVVVVVDLWPLLLDSQSSFPTSNNSVAILAFPRGARTATPIRLGETAP